MAVDQSVIDTILAKVQVLQADKNAADAATASSNSADSVVAVKHSELDAAQADAAQKKLDEATADAKATGDLQDLTSYLESLATPPTPPPAG